MRRPSKRGLGPFAKTASRWPLMRWKFFQPCLLKRGAAAGSGTLHPASFFMTAIAPSLKKRPVADGSEPRRLSADHAVVDPSICHKTGLGGANCAWTCRASAICLCGCASAEHTLEHAPHCRHALILSASAVVARPPSAASSRASLPRGAYLSLSVCL